MAQQATETTVRPGKESDLDGIRAVDPHLERVEWRTQLVRSALSRGSCLVCLEDDRVVGYGVLEHSFFGRGFVPAVYVQEERRRHGIATLLFDGLEARCRTDDLFTSTNESNEPMRALLKKRGYSESGVIENLDPNDKELVFVKNLDA